MDLIAVPGTRPSSAVRPAATRRAPLLAAPLLAALFLAAPLPTAAAGGGSLVVTPDRVRLEGPFERAQLLVRAAGTDVERGEDRSRSVAYAVADPAVARVSPEGVVSAVGDGVTRVVIGSGAAEAAVEVEVEVTGVGPAPRVDFDRDVLAVSQRSSAGWVHPP